MARVVITIIDDPSEAEPDQILIEADFGPRPATDEARLFNKETSAQRVGAEMLRYTTTQGRVISVDHHESEQ